MKEHIKNHLVIVVFLILFALLFMFNQVSISGLKSELNQAQAELVDLSNKRDMTATDKEVEQQKSLVVASGLDLKRQASDDKIATKMFENIFNWDSYASYENVRKALVSTYKMSEKDAMYLMPEVNVIVGENGKKLNEIDAYELNMKYVGMQSYVVGITGTSYHYLTEVRVKSSDVAGNESEGKILLEYSINFEEEISGVKAFVLANE